MNNTHDINSRIVLYDKEDSEIGDILEYIIDPSVKKESLCQGEINKQFIDESFEKADYLIVHYYSEHPNAIRGFASVLKMEDKEKKSFLYIDLICNIGFHNMKTRSTASKLGGKSIIHKVFELARQLNISEVRLSSVDTVIPYYKHLGFEFTQPDTKNKYKGLVKELRNTTGRERDRILGKIVEGQMPGFYSESTQRKLGQQELGTNRFDIAMENGIPMTKQVNIGGKKLKRMKLLRKSLKKSKGRKTRTNKKKKKTRVRKGTGKQRRNSKKL